MTSDYYRTLFTNLTQRELIILACKMRRVINNSRVPDYAWKDAEGVYKDVLTEAYRRNIRGEWEGIPAQHQRGTEKVNLYPHDCSAACSEPALYDITYPLPPPHYEGKTVNVIGACEKHLAALIMAFMTDDGVIVTRHRHDS